MSICQVKRRVSVLNFSRIFRFHNIQSEPSLEEAVIPCLRDDVQLSVDVYRNKLYELIASRKSRNRSESTYDSKESESSCDQEKSRKNGHTNSSVKSQLITTNGKYSVTQTGYREKHKNVGMPKNLYKVNGKSEEFSAPNKSKILEANDSVKVTVVARNFEKQKTHGWEMFSKKVSLGKISSNNKHDNNNSPEILKVPKGIRKGSGTEDLKISSKYIKGKLIFF